MRSDPKGFSAAAAQYVRQRRLWWLTVFLFPVVPVSLSSPILLLASRASFAASSLAALHALHPQNALLVGGGAPDSTFLFSL